MKKQNLWDRMASDGHSRTVAKRAVLGAPYGMPLDYEHQAAWTTFCRFIEEDPALLKPLWKDWNL